MTTTMLPIPTFLGLATQQTRLQIDIVEAAMQSCIEASRALADGLGCHVEPNERDTEEDGSPIDVPFGTIHFQREGGAVFAVVRAKVTIWDEAFSPIVETRLTMDFRHGVDPTVDTAASIVEKSRMMVAVRLRSAADVLETAPR